MEKQENEIPHPDTEIAGDNESRVEKISSELTYAKHCYSGNSSRKDLTMLLDSVPDWHLLEQHYRISLLLASSMRLECSRNTIPPSSW
jgi:hypothetical protein